MFRNLSAAKQSEVGTISQVDERTRKLLEVFARFRRSHWEQIRSAGIRPSRVFVLHCIDMSTSPDTPAIRVSAISDLMRVSRPTVTQLLDGLVADGLVERTADPTDRRAVRVALTTSGRAVLQEALSELHASMAGLVDYLGEEDSELLLRLLTRVTAYYTKQSEPISSSCDRSW